ncbi:MAG: MDR/SDR family oxidoreductase, partial [Pseudomonadota bacterium]
ETSVPIAPLSTVVPTLLADAPTRGLEVLAALSDPGGSARSTPPTGPRLEALRAGCMRAVAALLQYRQGPPARVLAIGFDADALRDLAGLSGMGCVFAADPHLAAGPLNSLEQAPATAPILPDPGGATRPAVDFVLVAAPGGAPTGAALRGLLDRLDPDGVLIAAEPDPASDALVERTETVWADPADGSAAVHLRHLPLPDERLSARLLLATGAPRPAPPATPPTPPIVLLADGPGVDGLGAALGLRPRSMARPGALAGRTLVIAVSASDTAQALTAQLTLCRAIARRPVDKRPEAVIWLTANALDRAPQSAAPGTAAVDAGVAALRRVMANELPSIRWHLIDGLSPDDDTQRAGHRQTAQAASLVRRIADGADPDLLQEREIWLDGEGCPWAPRRSRALAPMAPARTEAQVLSAGDAGSLARLGWQPGRDPGPDALGAGEVRVRVEAAGVNFRDVMAAIGRLPPRVLEGGLAGAGLGMEMAGTVIDAGRDAAFRLGDRVFGFAAGALASEVVTDHRLLGPLPEALSVSEAAALPAAYLTALYALETLARIRPGEQVLIHAATGGVGLAAAAVAQRQGAHVLATAGSTEKRRLAIALGAAEVFDSRDPGFADAVRATTGGGVDVVLNSLAGPALRRGIECLAPFGRFIELGKQDIAENRTIALATFAENLSFHALDADRLLTTRPAAVRALLARLAADIAAERLPKLPVATFGADEADLAFALMKRAAHIGKIVIRPPTTRRSRAVPAPARIGQERRPAWIIAGGTGGLGLEIAEALVRRRKARVLLVARRSPRAQSRQRIEALQR